MPLDSEDGIAAIGRGMILGPLLRKILPVG
jgi:hypothetical protein